jgi:hypothetical protein
MYFGKQLLVLLQGHLLFKAFFEETFTGFITGGHQDINFGGSLEVESFQQFAKFSSVSSSSQEQADLVVVSPTSGLPVDLGRHEGNSQQRSQCYCQEKL